MIGIIASFRLPSLQEFAQKLGTTGWWTRYGFG
jgi:hypothetical protein